MRQPSGRRRLDGKWRGWGRFGRHGRRRRPRRLSAWRPRSQRRRRVAERPAHSDRQVTVVGAIRSPTRLAAAGSGSPRPSSCASAANATRASSSEARAPAASARAWSSSLPAGAISLIQTSARTGVPSSSRSTRESTRSKLGLKERAILRQPDCFRNGRWRELPFLSSVRQSDASSRSRSSRWYCACPPPPARGRAASAPRARRAAAARAPARGRRQGLRLVGNLLGTRCPPGDPVYVHCRPT
jgi:hypothetical protein